MPSALPAEIFDPARVAAVEASRLAGSPAEEAFDRLARLAAKLLGTPRAFVTIVDADRSWYKSCIGVPEGAPRYGQLEDSFSQYVVGSGQPLVVGDARLDPRTSNNPAIESMGIAAWAGYPIVAPEGEVLGTLCVVDDEVRTWSEGEMEVLETLAQAASGEIALRAALNEAEEARVEAEVRAGEASELARALMVSGERFALLARTLQQSLLPPELPDVPGIEVAARYQPASTGDQVVGDFYDVFEGARSSWCIVMGDVCGKGPEAASVTALARYTLRAASLRSTRPRTALLRLNEALQRQRADDERFITVVAATVRRTRGRIDVALACAGHPLPLVRRAHGEVSPACTPGQPLGMFERPTVSEAHLSLEPGDALVFVTDGVLEARRDNEEYGTERLAQVVADAGAAGAVELADLIAASVERFREGPPADDTAILVLRVPSS